MKVLINEELTESFNSKVLYSKVLRLFTEYNMRQFAIRSKMYSPYEDSTTINEQTLTRISSNGELKNIILNDENLNYILEFENKIEFIKSQLTPDEEIIYKYSIEEGELDKVIMDRLCKSGHKYYEIKKSCYLKIALSFGLVGLKEEQTERKINTL